MSALPSSFDEIFTGAKDRIQIWDRFLNQVKARYVVEIGVWRGEFAANILCACPMIERYYMVDPWRHLDSWNKPANDSDEAFEKIMAEAMQRTDFAAERRVLLRGQSADVLQQIPDNSLDFAYVDADHSLRGITMDLQRVLPKIRPGGWIGGDDFSPSVWQHPVKYEPTFVFPYAVYFAEAIGAEICAVGFSQFLMSVPVVPRQTAERGFVDLTGRYGSTAVAPALRRPRRWESAPWVAAMRRAVGNGRRFAGRT